MVMIDKNKEEERRERKRREKGRDGVTRSVAGEGVE